MRRAKCFGINLAKLDIRQESSRHSQLLGICKKKNSNYLNWDENKKIKYLISEMKKNRKILKILILKIKKIKKFGQLLNF